jgi:hypothetical protein
VIKILKALHSIILGISYWFQKMNVGNKLSGKRLCSNGFRDRLLFQWIFCGRGLETIA